MIYLTCLSLSLSVRLHLPLHETVPPTVFYPHFLSPSLSFSLLVTLLLLKMSQKENNVYNVEEVFKERGPTLTFSNLYYCVQEKRFCCKRGPEKYILKDVR